MDNSAAGERSAVDARHPVLPPTNANISTAAQELMEVQSKGAGSKSVDPSEGSNPAKLQTAVGSVPTESHYTVFAAVVSAKASVIASTVSSMTALVAAATIAPVTRQGNARSTFLSGTSLEAKGTPASSLAPSAASLFQGYAPWPMEGPRIKREDDGLEVDESTMDAPAASDSAGGSVRSKDAAVGSTRTGRRRNDGVLFDNSSQGASDEVLRGVVEEGGAASEAVRGARAKMGSSASSQQRPGWKYTCESKGCMKSASFGFFGGKGQFCVTHKIDGMINLRRGRCRVQDCPKPPTRVVTSGQTFRYCKEHQPMGLSRKCGHPGGCDRVATHAPPLLPLGSEAAPKIKVDPSTADSTGSSCVSSAVSPKAKGKSEVVEGSTHRGDNDNGDAGAGGVTTEAGSGDGANSSSSSSIPAEATEAVRASDDVGSAATVAVNGKGETAADTSGASSSGAGACSVVKKDVSSGDGEAGVPPADVDASMGVRQPTRCLEHAGPGWMNVYSVDNGVVGLERSKRRRASTGGWASSQSNDYFWGYDDKMEGCTAGRSSSKPEDALGDSTSSPQAADPAAKGEGNAESPIDLGGDYKDGEDAGDGESELSPNSPGGGTSKKRWFGKTANINDNCPHPNSKHYCRGMCNLCYMKEYNRKTRALNGGGGKPSQKPAANKSASSEGDAPTSPEGGAAPFLGLRKRHRPEVKMEAIGNSPKQIVVKEKSWRKTISSCEHTDAPHYGKGFCRPCYMREYHKAKRSGGIVVRLSAPPRVEIGSKAPENKGALSSGPKEDGTAAAGGRTGDSANGGKAAAAVTGGVGGRSTSRGMSIAVPKTTALPPPLCGVCGQTEKSWPLVLICDGCEGKFHLGCQGLVNQPFGEWFCHSCTDILLDSDSDIEARPELPEKGRSLPTPSALSPRTNAARNLRVPASTKAYTRSAVAGAATPIQRSDESIPSEKKDDHDSSGESTVVFSGDGPNIGGGINNGGADVEAEKGEVVGNSAMGWQTPRPSEAATASESGATPSAVTAGTPPTVGERSNGRFERTAAVADAAGRGKWPLRGDVRDCRCPTCVSILLQSGGTRLPKATELIVPSKAKAPIATAAASKKQRKRSTRPSPRAEDVSSGPEKISTTGVAENADGAPVAGSTLYRRVIVRAGSPPAPLVGAASSSTTSPVIALSACAPSIHASPASASSVDARVGFRPSRGKGRKRHRDDEQSEWMSMSNSSDEADEGANGYGRKGAGSAASYSMSSDGESSSNDKEGNGGRRRPAKKRVGKSIHRAGPGMSVDTSAEGQGVATSTATSGTRKGVSCCGHSNRPVYSKGLCKPCYMVRYSNRRQVALGIKPRSPRAASLGEQRVPPSDAYAKMAPAVGFGDATTTVAVQPSGGPPLDIHAGDGDDAPGSPATRSLRASVGDSPSSSDAGDLLVSSDNGEASTVSGTAKRTKVNEVAALKIPE